MSITSIVILMICVGLMVYSIISYGRSFIGQWSRNESWRPDGNELAKLEQKQENTHQYKMKEGFHGEDETKNV